MGKAVVECFSLVIWRSGKFRVCVYSYTHTRFFLDSWMAFASLQSWRRGRTNECCQGALPRACLKIGDVSGSEGFWASGKQFFRRNPGGFQGKIAPSRGQKTRRLGMLTFFKQALSREKICNRQCKTNCQMPVPKRRPKCRSPPFF